MEFLGVFLVGSAGSLLLALIEWAVGLRSLGGLRRVLSARQNPDEVLAHGLRWHECNERAKGSPGIFFLALGMAAVSGLVGIVGAALGWRID